MPLTRTNLRLVAAEHGDGARTRGRTQVPKFWARIRRRRAAVGHTEVAAGGDTVLFRGRDVGGDRPRESPQHGGWTTALCDDGESNLRGRVSEGAEVSLVATTHGGTVVTRFFRCCALDPR